MIASEMCGFGRLGRDGGGAREHARRRPPEWRARLARRLAAADVVARIGGDEFVIVAAGVRQQDAPGLLRRIEEAFARDPVHIGDLSLHLSCSLGLVCEPGGPGVRPGSVAERAEELLSDADREMYERKRSRAGVRRLLQLAESQPRASRPVTDQR